MHRLTGRFDSYIFASKFQIPRNCPVTKPAEHGGPDIEFWIQWGKQGGEQWWLSRTEAEEDVQGRRYGSSDVNWRERATAGLSRGERDGQGFRLTSCTRLDVHHSCAIFTILVSYLFTSPHRCLPTLVRKELGVSELSASETIHEILEGVLEHVITYSRMSYISVIVCAGQYISNKRIF